MEIPWSIKGILGAFSDVFPMFGYHKRSHMIMYSLLSTVSAFLFLVLPQAFLSNAPEVLYLLYFFLMVACSAVDLLCEGKFTRIMIDVPDSRGDIVSFIWFVQNVAGLTVGLYVGALLDAYGTTPVFWLIFIFNIQVLILVIFNFIDEEPVAKEYRNKIDMVKVKEMGPYFLLAAVMGVLLVGSLFVGLFGNTLTNLLYSYGIGIFLLSLAYFLLPWRIANCNVFLFLTCALFPSLDAPTERWYTASETCVPGGPQFNQFYYQFVSGTISSMGEIAAIVIFQSFLANWELRTLYWFSLIIRGIASINDYILMNRWNVNIGISDYALFFIGDGIVQSICYMINFLPPTILLSRMCPKDIESTAYAILAGFSNFGNLIAAATGQYLQEAFDIKFAGDDCTYSALPLTLLICTGGTAILSIPIAHYFIPPWKVSDPSRLEDITMDHTLYNIYKRKKAEKYAVSELTSTSAQQDVPSNKTLSMTPIEF